MSEIEFNDLDSALVGLCQDGNPLAFEKLVAKYRPRIVGQAMSMLNDHYAAESAAQDVLLRLHKSISAFRGDAQFSTWLYRVTANVCLTRLAAQRRERDKLDAFGHEGFDESHADEQPAGPDFATLISGVSRDEQQILTMRFVWEWELGEIAAAMNLGISATKMRLYRALEKLRDHFVSEGLELAA